MAVAAYATTDHRALKGPIAGALERDCLLSRGRQFAVHGNGNPSFKFLKSLSGACFPRMSLAGRRTRIAKICMVLSMVYGITMYGSS